MCFASNGENVLRARVPDPELIHRSLMGSSGHKENILKPEFDEAGIGMGSSSDGMYFVTQDFIKSVPVREEAEVRAIVQAALDSFREGRGLAPLRVVDEVQGTARIFALARSAGRETPPIPESFGETRVHFYAGPDLEAIVGSLAEIPVDHYRIAGVGVRFARTAGYSGGAYFVCVFFLVGDPPR